MKICHMTNVHSSRDIRIFIKECVTLAEAGHDVYHVAFGDSREELGVHVIGLGAEPKGRRERMTKSARLVFETAKSLDCDVYHFHDPELLPYGLKLKKLGKKVIFDSHEDVAAQILHKGWIPAPLRKLVSQAYHAYETSVIKQLDAVVVATPFIAKQFEGRASRIVDVNNYPKLEDITCNDAPFEEREPIVCYAGGISELYGKNVMRDAMKSVAGKLIMAGACHDANCAEEIGGENVTYVGYLSREGINDLYSSAVVGLAVLLPCRNFVNSKPTKVYEYMAAGLPFISTDFPYCVEVVEKWKCGICVPAGDIEKISNAISMLLEDRSLAQEMGQRGRLAVKEEYNWKVEGEKLVALYDAIAK